MTKAKLVHRWLLTLAFSLAALGAAGCFGKKGSGNAATETRAVGAFSEVEVRGSVTLEVSMGEAHRLELSGDDNLLPLVETTIEGSRLVIRPKQDVNPELPLVARVTTPDLKLVKGSGATEVSVRDVDNQALEVELSGAGKMAVAGKTGELTLRVSGAGSVDAKDAVAEKIAVHVSGAGSVEVGAPKELKVDVSGAGSVSYDGSPTITKHISGSGSVDKR
jgi:hypothetical protein